MKVDKKILEKEGHIAIPDCEADSLDPQPGIYLKRDYITLGELLDLWDYERSNRGALICLIYGDGRETDYVGMQSPILERLEDLRVNSFEPVSRKCIIVELEMEEE